MAREEMTRELVEFLAGKKFDELLGEGFAAGNINIDLGTFGNSDAFIDFGSF